MIRISSKVIIVKDGKILLNHCRRSNGDVYYDLPGGGQHDYESMEEAAVREVKEETGYSLSELRLAALGEEICSNPELRKRFPNYSHRIFHIFIGKLDGRYPNTPTEKDLSMEKSIWISIDDLYGLPEIYPKGLIIHLPEILEGNRIVYLDTFYNDMENI